MLERNGSKKRQFGVKNGDFGQVRKKMDLKRSNWVKKISIFGGKYLNFGGSEHSGLKTAIFG